MSNVSEFSQSSPAEPDAWLYLEEIAHRTLNECTAMLSMLVRASYGTTDAVGLAVLDAVAKRLRAMASTYKVLRPFDDSSTRNLEDDLEQLCASLTASVLAERRIRLTLASDPVVLSARRSWQVTLIVSELVMNAAKHAFTRSTEGSIVVDIRKVGKTVECAVIDDGAAGAPVAPGRGARIVDALAVDLGGSIARNFSARGSTVVLHMPIA
jgi:two-component sensor histidine kinase